MEDVQRTIIEKLAATIERKELGVDDKPLPFVYADEGLQNIILEGVEMPFAACVPISSSAVVADDGQYHERITVAVFFGDCMVETGSDYDAIENERIIDTCKRRAFLWLTSLHLPIPNRELSFVSVTTAERGYLRLDGNYTGFAVVATLEEISGVGMCEWKEATAPKFWEFVFDNKKYLKIGDNVELVGAHCYLQVQEEDAYIGGDLRRGSQIGSRSNPAEQFSIILDIGAIVQSRKNVSKIEIEACCAYNSQFVPYFDKLTINNCDFSGGYYPELTPDLTRYSWTIPPEIYGAELLFSLEYCGAAVWIKSIKLYFENA